MKNIYFFKFLIISNLLIMSSKIIAQPQSWQPRGIGGGGALFSASISPIDKNEIYLSCDMSELFHSKDFGNNWTFVHYNQIQSNNTRSVVRFTNDPKIQYTINWSGNDVATPVRTNDGGENWKKLNNDPTNGEAFTLWADPHSTQRLLISDYKNLYFSNDGGEIWVKKYSDNTMCYVAGVFWDSEKIYIGIDKGLLISKDNGVTFNYDQKRFPTQTDKMVSFTGAKQNNITRFFCVTLGSGDVYPGLTGAEYSNYQHTMFLEDNSPSWETCENGLIHSDKPFFVGMAENDINTVYLAGGSDDGVPIVMKSIDGAKTWKSVFKTSLNENIKTGWQGKGGDREWSYDEYALGFAVCATDVNRLVLTGLGFPHVTSDGGNNWKQAYIENSAQNNSGSVTPKGKFYKSIGIENTTSWQIMWSDKNTMFAGFADIKGIRSIDAGNSWQHCYNNLSTNAVYFTTKNPTGTLYGAISSVHDMYQSTYLTDARIDGGKGGVITSKDNGMTWTILHDFQHPVIWLALDPKNPNIMYASVIHSTQGGIYVSKNLNNGVNTTWTKLTAPPRTEGHPYNIQILNDGSLLATYSARRTNAFTQSSGVFLSIDGGISWLDRTDKVNMGYWTKDVVVDLADVEQKTWYAGVWSGYGGPSNNKGGLYKTTDRGLNWSLLLDLPSKVNNTNRVSSSAINPSNTNEMYVTTETDGLWFTNNLQSIKPTFKQISSYPFRQPERVFYNPYVKDEIWITSFGNGLKVSASGTTTVKNSDKLNYKLLLK